MPIDVYPVQPSQSQEATASDIAQKINFAEEHGGRLITDITVATEQKRFLSPQNLITYLVFEYDGELPDTLPWENRATPDQVSEALDQAMRGN